MGLAFRIFNDGGVHFAGFWVDNVAIEGTVISDGSTLDGWQSATQYNPIEVEGYTVQLVAYDDLVTRRRTCSASPSTPASTGT